MSTLYHISRTTGKAARCTASVRACPNGGMHFTSEAEALLNAPVSAEMPVSAKLRKLGVKQVVVTDEAGANLNSTRGNASKSVPAIDFAANAEYAERLKSIDISGVRGVLPYKDDQGRFVSRSQMASRLEELERTQAGRFAADEFRQQLLRADATHLRAMKEQWAKTNRDYRAEHGPATRPDFGGMLEEHARKVAEAKVKRDAGEDSIPLSLRGFFGLKKNSKAAGEPSSPTPVRADVVPASVIGEFVGSVANSARNELREQRAFLKDEFNDFFNRG